MQAQNHDAIVLVHGIGNGEQQGDFLVDVAEPLLRWMGENGARFDERSTSGLRRGDRPSQIEVAGTLPDPAGGGGERTFRWRLVEARWSDEFRAPPERTALGWSRRAYPESVLDQLSYYDTVWRFWRLLARIPAVGGAFRWLGNGPPTDADGDDFRWAYRYRVGWSLSRKAAYAAWFGLVAPLVLLALATPILLPLALPWVLAGRWLESPRWSRWERAYFNAIYRLLLVLARVPLLAVGYLLLLALTVVSAVPLAIPGVEPARRAISTAIQMQFADTYVYNLQLVQAWAIADAVERVIRDEAARCRTLTVLAYSQGTVVAYEALSRLARGGVAASPIARPGLELRLITVGAALNRARGHALGGDGAVRSLLALPLPPGTRWVDIWAMHDPVPMGSIAGELCERAGVAPLEVRVSNTLTELDAHTSYWQNEVEVLSVLAEELAAAPSEAAKLEPPGASLAPLQPRTRVGAPASGFWGWRVRHGRTARAVAHWRRQRFLFGLAALRAAGYVFVFGVLAWVALAGAPADRLLAEADGVPFVQTPMRWFWAPLSPSLDLNPGDTVVSSGAEGAFTVREVTEAGAAGSDGWVLAGPGSLVGWGWVRYAAFPVVAHVAATVLYFVPFLMVQRVVIGIGRRVWDPPARGVSATER